MLTHNCYTSLITFYKYSISRLKRVGVIYILHLIDNKINVYFISSLLEFSLVNHTLVYKISELKVFKNIKFLGEISNKSNDLLGTNL